MEPVFGQIKQGRGFRQFLLRSLEKVNTETVLLVHEYASSARLWHLAMARMAPSRFQVIALNNRGAGESERTTLESDYSVESFAADLHNAAEALGLGNFTLVLQSQM